VVSDKHYVQSFQEVFADLGTSEKGLTSREARARLEKSGKNLLFEEIKGL